jgi:hypothetical protein
LNRVLVVVDGDDDAGTEHQPFSARTKRSSEWQ